MDSGIPKVRWLRLIAGTVLVTILVPMGIEHFRIRAEISQTAETLPGLLAQAEKEGIPLKWEQLDPHLLPENNAAPLYVQASEKFVKLPGQAAIDQNLFPVEGDAGAAKRREALKACAEILPLLEIASKRPHCFFERDWSQTWLEGAYGNSARQLKSLIKLACAQAEWDARAARMDSCFAWLQVGATISRHMGEEPSMMGWMMQSSMEEIVVNSMQRVVKPSRISLPQVDLLRKIVGTLNATPELGLRGEFLARFRLYDDIDKIFEQFPPQDRWESYAEALPWSQPTIYFSRRAFLPTLQDRDLVTRAFQARLLGRWIPFFRAVEAARGDHKKLAAATETLGMAISNGTHRMDRAEDQMNALDGYIGGTLRQDLTRHRQSRQMLDVLAFRARTGRLPKDLREAGTPQFDPFDGALLRYRPQGDGFVIYSVGENGVDEGGMPQRGYQGDILFQLPKRP